MQEIWKDVEGTKGLYQVSNLGRIKSLKIKDKPLIMKLGHKETGYSKINMTINGKQITKTVHRLVALAFLPNPNQCKEVNHKNRIRDDNRVDNLEWVTREENMRYTRYNKHSKLKTYGVFVDGKLKETYYGYEALSKNYNRNLIYCLMNVPEKYIGYKIKIIPPVFEK